jgi:hypothetical protein
MGRQPVAVVNFCIKKRKGTPNRPEGPDRGIEVYLYSFLNSVLEGVGGQHHATAALSPGKTRYPLYRRLGGPQGRYRRVLKISPLTVFDPLTVQSVAIPTSIFYNN